MFSNVLDHSRSRTIERISSTGSGSVEQARSEFGTKNRIGVRMVSGTGAAYRIVRVHGSAYLQTPFDLTLFSADNADYCTSSILGEPKPPT